MARKIKIDNAELKRRKYQKRSHEGKDIVCRILIVCEGLRTEPDYFEAFNKNRWGTVVINLECEGGGIETLRVVEKALELKEEAEKNHRAYDRVWAVFDKDSFPDVDFNAAIVKARCHGIGCAWSNEAFELWYLLHFHNRISPMRRTEYEKAISDAVNGSSSYKAKKRYAYRKNDRNNFKTMNQCGCQANAIKWADELVKNCDDQCYAKHNPCTTVYELVRQLIGEDAELKRELLEKGNEK